jgi:hypothetical protein
MTFYLGVEAIATIAYFVGLAAGVMLTLMFIKTDRR